MAILSPILAALLQLALVRPEMQSPRAPEYQVKAVFVFNFAQFVEWPGPAAASMRICILGDDPFGGLLDETVRGERLGTRPFEVRRFRAIGDVEGCDILFISRSEAERMSQILETLRNRPTLTVSDAADFAKRGGMIQFFNDKNRVRLRINREAAERADLTISSKLLRVAELARGSTR